MLLLIGRRREEIFLPAADYLLRLFIIAIYAPRKTTLPGVCSPVEAGEVARVACRRGGDLPRGLHYVQNDTFLICHRERKSGDPRNNGRSGCSYSLFLFGDATFAKFDKVLDLHLSDISLRPVADGNFARSRFLLADYEHIRNTL